ncbi:hypothetical protein SAMN04488591_0116 [Microbacterium azadirachtae]|uniref:CU044_5270 family protein n=1 Tax=Microbacterium azadirachtae TaxID=582680 RepID=A0A1I6FPP9_9MICO|nr:hypothetical protein [Microbacterium azadirachtae]SFR31920.1 hypothetical protein SAMN04488591_0116 [Microbacterium azadirachtae]
MDVFERVRDVNTGVELTLEQMSKARSLLLTGIEERADVARKRSARRPLYLIAGGVVGVAAVTAAVLVVNHSAAPAPRVEAVRAPSASPVPSPATSTPEPTPSLGRGAGTSVVEPFPGTTPQAGQYLEITSTDESLVYRGQADSEVQYSHWSGEIPPVAAVLLRSVDRLYVPGDRTAEWVGRTGPVNERVRIYPDGTPADPLIGGMFPYREDVQGWTNPGGIGGEVQPLQGSLGWAAQYPNDPQALLQYLRDRASARGMVGEAGEQAVANDIIGVLLTNYAPAQTRATFIKALDLTGRAQISSTAGTLVTRSVHLTELYDGPRTVAVTIDSATGWVVEYDERWDHDGSGGVVPSEVPGVHRSFTVTIVDGLP